MGTTDEGIVGCSFSFEQALIQANLTPRHLDLGLYRTHVQNLVPPVSQRKAVFTNTDRIPDLKIAADFGGNMVVSMRPSQPGLIERVRDITRPFHKVHGESVAWVRSPLSSCVLPILN